MLLSTQTAQTNELADTIIIFKEKEKEREGENTARLETPTQSPDTMHACDISKYILVYIGLYWAIF